MDRDRTGVPKSLVALAVAVGVAAGSYGIASAASGSGSGSSSSSSSTPAPPALSGSAAAGAPAPSGRPWGMQRNDETPLTGGALAKVTAIAKAKVPERDDRPRRDRRRRQRRLRGAHDEVRRHSRDRVREQGLRVRQRRDTLTTARAGLTSTYARWAWSITARSSGSPACARSRRSPARRRTGSSPSGSPPSQPAPAASPCPQLRSSHDL